MSDLSKIKKVVEDIAAINIQWATNIAKAAIETLWQEIMRQKFWSISELDKFLQDSIILLKEARETEPMLFNWLKYCSWNYKKLLSKKGDLKTIQKKLRQACKEYVQDIEYEEKVRPNIWAKLIKRGYNIMTHCHSGSVVKILTTAWWQEKEIHVYNTETRPLYQWRRTSNDLIKAWVPNTMITDDSAPFFIDNLYESHVYIDMVIIGCDNIKTNGGIYNKIWSFAIAMAARHAGTPVYVVGSLMKVDESNSVKIERRAGKELRQEAPKWLEIINYAFDMVPAKFITW
jgi:ribose 1,5-bisphosphate isomerase